MSALKVMLIFERSVIQSYTFIGCFVHKSHYKFDPISLLFNYIIAKDFSNNKYSLTCFLRFHINQEKERQKVLHNHSKYQRLRGEIFTYFVLTCFTLLKFYNKVRKGHSMSAKNFKCAC